MTKANSILKIAATCAGTLVVAGGIVFTSVAVGRANASALTDEAATEETAKAFVDVEIPEGRYFLNGNADSEYWINVTPDTIDVCGPDIEGEVYNALKAENPDESDDTLRRTASNYVQEYLEPNPYRAVILDGCDTVNVAIKWEEEDGLISGYGFEYSDNVISWMTGDFVLAD